VTGKAMAGRGEAAEGMLRPEKHGSEEEKATKRNHTPLMEECPTGVVVPVILFLL
jgi:hypothetical protein